MNKVDRLEQRAEQVIDEVFDLLVELGANDAQLDFPVVYASAKQASAARTLDEKRSDLRPLLEAILEHAPPPTVDVDEPLQFQAMTLDWDEFVGRIVIGRVARGRLTRGAQVVRIPPRARRRASASPSCSARTASSAASSARRWPATS